MEKELNVSLTPFLETLSHNEKNDLLKISRKLSYKKEETIFEKGEKSESVVILLKGSAKVISTSIDGKELIITFIKPGHIFGELSAIDNLPHTATIVAIDDCDALVINNGQFITFLNETPTAYKAILEKLAYIIRFNSKTIEDFAFYTIKTRLLRNILSLAQKDTEIKATQGDLAKILAVSREKVNQALKDIERENFIKVSRGAIKIISKDKIRNYLINEGAL